MNKSCPIRGAIFMLDVNNFAKSFNGKTKQALFSPHTNGIHKHEDLKRFLSMLIIKSGQPANIMTLMSG
jgi:hypothetical protein